MISRFLKPFGYRVQPIPKDEDFVADPDFLDIFRKCKPYTMTSIERMYSLYTAVKYAIKNEIPGDFVECGVWRGGSSMMITLTLAHLGVSDRKIYLYDTYEGMSDPTEADKDFVGRNAAEMLEETKDRKETSVWCLAGIEDVTQNLFSTGYPKENLIFVKGKVEDTLPATLPEQVALLRLDTDWYESTRHELIHLYPLLQKDGVLIIDDYGHWEGCRKAVDEYFADKKILLNRIDYTGRIAVKP